MTAAHSGGISYNYHASTPSLAVGSTPGCGFSMEIYPVTYVDEHGRVKTEWGTDVHNCHGGSTRIDVAQPAERARPARFANDPQVR